MNLIEYGNILISLIIGVIISLVLFSLSYILILRKYDLEKISAYECGFDPFTDARGKFDVRFYLVAILFIIFDLEVMFLFPWTISLKSIDLFGYLSMMVFLLLLGLGFLYEWNKGALDWE